MPKNQFFHFQKLSEVARNCKGFMNAYSSLPRNSEKCKEYYTEVSRCIGYVRFIKSQVGKYFDFTIENFLPHDFIISRQADERKLLVKVDNGIKNATAFILAFTSVRKKDNKNFGENDGVRRLERRSKPFKDYFKNLQALRESLDAWETSLLTENPSPGDRKNFESFVTEVVKVYVNNIPIFAKTKSIISEFKNMLRETDTKKAYIKRFAELIPVMKDIQGSLHHHSLQLMIEEASKRLGDAAKGKKKKEANVDPMSIPNGIQTLGPFGIRPVVDEWKKLFDFGQTANTLEYHVDVSPHMGKGHSASQVDGRTSPVSAISITDQRTKSMLKIPATAAYYAFVYPVPRIEGLVLQTKKGYTEESNPANCLLSYGGYVYYDKDKKMVQLNGLDDKGSDIYFTGPFTLDDKAKTMKKLTSQNRFAQVTMPELYKQGARMVAWLTPGELLDKNHGSLLFTYEDPAWEPTYFDVVNIALGEAIAQEDSKAVLDKLLDGYVPADH